MKFFAVLICFFAVLAVAMSGTPPSGPTSGVSSSSPTTTTYTYTTTPTSTSPTSTYTDTTTTSKPFKQQLLSLLFNKNRSG
ncbi:integumentary mucin C.1 [Drosophila biarmipes]|uniref:integumentary mucin C.1 n=1 Tax=Drosophila biarmipes TaxID=125945 RepID=UPI0007E5E422|nr:integumentary mucin C.1 [Drosophila biarmipes]